MQYILLMTNYLRPLGKNKSTSYLFYGQLQSPKHISIAVVFKYGESLLELIQKIFTQCSLKANTYNKNCRYNKANFKICLRGSGILHNPDSYS